MNFVELLLIHENMIVNIRPDSKFCKMVCRSIEEYYKPMKDSSGNIN